MKNDQIWVNATKIWQRLETDLTDTNLNTLEKDFNMSQPELCAALGWLAKEERITFINYDKETYVFPIEK